MFTRSALLAGLVLFGCQREDTTSPVPPAPPPVTEQVEPAVRATNTEGAAVTVESVTEVAEPDVVGNEVIVVEDDAPTSDQSARQAREKPITQRRSTRQPTQPQQDQTNTTNETTDQTQSTDDPIGTDAQNQGIGGGDTYDRNR